MKTVNLSKTMVVALALAGCVQAGADNVQEDLEVGAAPPHLADVERSAPPPLPACPFVCPSEEVVPDGDHMACGFAGGVPCAAEPSCGAVWTLVDRLSCDPVRTQDGRAFVSKSNNCLVERPDGTWTACVSHDALPFCVVACAPPSTLSCVAESCVCAVPNGESFSCVGAP